MTDQESRGRRPSEGYLAARIAEFAPLSPEASAALGSLVVRRDFAHDEWILRGGEHARWCFLIRTGLVRELYVGADGAEHTRALLAEGSFTGSLLDLLVDQPAVTFIQALEPTETLAFVYRDFVRLCDDHPSLQRAARHFLEALYVRKAVREHELLALSAQERYQRWIKGDRALDARVRRRDVASYLGMRPEHLSRLRARRGG
jgi:CRP-like cAMP-binding protein